jgi:hypothetical protein
MVATVTALALVGTACSDDGNDTPAPAGRGRRDVSSDRFTSTVGRRGRCALTGRSWRRNRPLRVVVTAAALVAAGVIGETSVASATPRRAGSDQVAQDSSNVVLPPDETPTRRRYGGWLSVESATSFEAGSTASLWIEVPAAAEPNVGPVVLSMKSTARWDLSSAPDQCWLALGDGFQWMECLLDKWETLRFRFRVPPEPGTFTIDYQAEPKVRGAVIRGPVTEVFTIVPRVKGQSDRPDTGLALDIQTMIGDLWD